MRPLRDGGRPGVEDAAAAAAPVVEDRLAAAAADPQASPPAAVRAGQAVGVEQFRELGVAGGLIQVVDRREVHAPYPDPRHNVITS
jgi:hypothetical protein